MLHIPAEVLWHIFSYLPTKPSSTFLQLSLTSKAIHSVANEFLYRAPYVESEIHLKLLGITLKSNKELAGLVRELSINWNRLEFTRHEEALQSLLALLTGTVHLSVTDGVLRWFGDMLQPLDQLERLSLRASDLQAKFRHPSTRPLPSIRFLALKNIAFRDDSTFATTFTSLTSFSFLISGPMNLGYRSFSIEFLAALPPTLKTLRIYLGDNWRWFQREGKGDKQAWETVLGRFQELEVFETDFRLLAFAGEEAVRDEEVAGGLFRLLPQQGKLLTAGLYFSYIYWEDIFVVWLQFVLELPTSFLSSVQTVNLYCSQSSVNQGKWELAKEMLRDQNIKVNIILGDEGEFYERTILKDPTWGFS